jgi:hypothetical protein
LPVAASTNCSVRPPANLNQCSVQVSQGQQPDYTPGTWCTN